MDYPHDFSIQAQNRVEAERIRAEQERDAQIKGTRLAYFSDTETREEAAINCILRVFLAFAKEACALGRNGTWAISRIRSEVDRFLLQLARDVEREIGPRGGTGYIKELTFSGSLDRDVRRRFEKSTQWKEYQDLLLGLEDVKEPLSNRAEATMQHEVLAQTPAGLDGKSHCKSWEEIDISFLSDERIQIRISGAGGFQTLNYAESGFADQRNETPNSAWATLKILAKNRGTITESTSQGQRWRDTEKRIQEIRRVFKNRFGLMEDPLPYVKNVGYKARFKVQCGLSFET